MPKIVESRVEKERRAILSELQMMNTIEYRVDCQVNIYVTFGNFYCKFHKHVYNWYSSYYYEFQVDQMYFHPEDCHKAISLAKLISLLRHLGSVFTHYLNASAIYCVMFTKMRSVSPASSHASIK
jgi:hypothetical protein